MEELRYNYSQLSSESVSRLASLNYDLPEIRCKFYVLGLHDNYLIESKQEKYILRIYRNEWRSLEEIYFELELLAYLGKKKVLVASPLLTKTGELTFFIDSPEGERAAALFRFADGHAPCNELSTEQSALLGSAVANIHNATDGFDTQHRRPLLDIPYLLDESISRLEPFLGTDAWSYLKKLQIALHQTVPVLPRERGVHGICIGDVNPTNFHINENNEITLFDFDQCGYGFRTFEIGKFISTIYSSVTKNALTEAFIDGYQKVRRLSQEEVDAIPYYEIISVIWVMAIHANNVNRIGHKWLQKPFWDRQLVILKELDNYVLGN